jgi:tRNA(fMet)-specific endonuclease VapC
MTLFDTDHASVLVDRGHSLHATLVGRVEQAVDQRFALPIVCVEEQCRGWLALIHRLPEVHRQVAAYDRLAELFDFVHRWEIARFVVQAADGFKRLRGQGIRIGTQDLKIAAIALVNEALLLSANLRDFRRVPNLRVENWLV